MTKNLSTLALLLTSLLILLAGCKGKTVNEYGYVFHETTGQNQYIIKDGHQYPIHFDNTSDQIALKSLNALKPGILIQNNDGKRIFLSGEYNDQSQSFRLSHWYIKTPFEEMVTEDKMRLPHTVHKVTRESLDRKDFDPKNGFDPNDRAFDPKSFQKSTQ